MRITQLTPGTGHFYCGNCLRETALARSLRDLGHDVTLLPLYLPVFTEGELPPPQPPRVFLGGINIFMQHQMPWFAKLPAFVRRWLDAPGLLRWSSRRGDMTDAAKHADLTLSMLRSDEPGQLAEIRQMVRWMRENDPPEIISLCNLLLVGLARPIKAELDVPVVVTMHGEDAFLDAFPEPQRAEAWSILRERMADIDACIAVSDYYGGRMLERLRLDADRVHVVHNGIQLDDIEEPRYRPDPSAPVVGYLAHMRHDKGLHTLVDAFIELKRRNSIRDLRLRVAGVKLKGDRRYVREQQQKLRRAGVLDDVQFLPNVPREQKLDFLRSLQVLSVPATYGEAFGLYLIEAFACGVPAVQPRHGAFPEILERAGGGLLCEPDDPTSLADGLERLLSEPDLAGELSEAARRSVVEHFNAERMARDIAEVYDRLLDRSQSSPPQPSPHEAPVEA